MSIIPDTITIMEADKPRELFMSFGLLNELLMIVGDIPDISTIGINPDLRFAVLNSVLAERDGNGLVTKPLVMFTLRVTTPDIQRLISWVAEHLLNFFLTAIEQNLVTHTRHQGRLTGSTGSGSGSPVSQ